MVEVFNFNFFNYGTYFNGSYRGLRYRLGREPLKPPKDAGEVSLSMRCWIWHEPFSFNATPDEEKQVRDFDYSEEGLASAIDWIEEVYEKRS